MGRCGREKKSEFEKGLALLGWPRDGSNPLCSRSRVESSWRGRVFGGVHEVKEGGTR